MRTNLEATLLKHITRLAVEIGPRPSGSKGNHTAADYIRDVFQAAGLEVEDQRYECTAWEHRETTLELDGAEMEVAANAFSRPCDVRAPTVAVGTVEELEVAELQGRLGVLYGDLTRSPISAKSWFLKSERDDRIVRLLEEKRPAALITVQAGAGDLIRVIEDREFTIPSATVPAKVGLALLRKNEPTVGLRIQSQSAPGFSQNVIGRKSGTSREKVVLCAHFDTKIDTPGACDNAGGVAALLALSDLLGSRKQTLGLECVAFSNEEYLPMGDDEYVRLCGHQFDQIIAAINFDGVGQYLGANNITMMTNSESFRDCVAELTLAYRGVVWVAPWPESNHSTFANRGVPSVAFGSRGAALAHLRSDTVEWVSPAKLSEVVSLATDIVESLQEKAPDWTREPKPTDPDRDG